MTAVIAQPTNVAPLRRSQATDVIDREAMSRRDELILACAARVTVSAWESSLSSHWSARAEAFEEARPGRRRVVVPPRRPGMSDLEYLRELRWANRAEYTGRATVAELAEVDRRCAEAAARCRDHAGLFDGRWSR